MTDAFRFNHLVAVARREEPKLVTAILTASITGSLSGIGREALIMPTEIIAQRAVGTLALVLLYLDKPEDLFTEADADVQTGAVGAAIPKAT